MRDKQMPDDALKSLAVRRDVRRVDCRNNHTSSGFLRRVATIPPDDANNRSANTFGELNCVDQIRADVFFKIAATDGKNQHAVFCSDSTALKPFGKDGWPAFIV